MPGAELLLWQYLRNRQLGGLRFRRQHPIGPFYVDFYCPECQLVVEIDGASHEGTKALTRDAWRDQRMAEIGIKVLRFQGKEVRRSPEGVLERIYEETTGNVFAWEVYGGKGKAR